MYLFIFNFSKLFSSELRSSSFGPLDQRVVDKWLQNAEQRVHFLPQYTKRDFATFPERPFNTGCSHGFRHIVGKAEGNLLRPFKALT